MRLLLLSFSIILASMACNPFKKQDTKGTRPVDVFYTDRGGFGTYLRIPLIKPYEVIKISDNEWRVELHTTQLLELSIHNIQKINVIDSLIILYANGEVSIKDTKYNEAWFIINPFENSEKGFEKQEDFLLDLKMQGIKNPSFYNVNQVYEEFYNSKKLKWDLGN